MTTTVSPDGLQAIWRDLHLQGLANNMPFCPDLYDGEFHLSISRLVPSGADVLTCAVNHPSH